MRLYTRTGATALDDPEYGHFEANADGAFDLPDDVSGRLHSFHIGGKPAWETDIERQARLFAEEAERRKDPASLLDAVEQIMRAAQATQTAPEPAPTAKATRARKAAAAE
jgi:hypothetical protein